MNGQESGKGISILIQNCQLGPVKLHLRVVIHQIYLDPDGRVLYGSRQGNYFPLVLPVRSVHVDSGITGSIAVRRLQLFYIILAQWQIRRKDSASHLAGAVCICLHRRLRRGNQRPRLHHGFPSVILNIFRRIQAENCACKGISRLLVLLFDGNPHLLAGIGIGSIPVNHRNLLACVSDLDFTGRCVLL